MVSELNLKELGSPVSIFLTKLQDQTWSKKLKKMIHTIMKNHMPRMPQLTSAIQSWQMDTAPTFQLQLLPQILPLSQSKQLACKSTNPASLLKVQPHQLSNLTTWSSHAVIGKLPWFKTIETNSTSKRSVFSTPTPRELERWTIKIVLEFLVSWSNHPLSSMLTQSWDKLVRLKSQRRLFPQRNSYPREPRRVLRDQKRLSWTPKIPTHLPRKTWAD